MEIYISKADDLITTHEQTRAGFIEAALVKSDKAKPYIVQASSLKAIASKINSPKKLLKEESIRPSLLTASGLSDKALKHFTDEDKTVAINKLIETFLIPAGSKFVDELVYRFLIFKGDRKSVV